MIRKGHPGGWLLSFVDVGYVVLSSLSTGGRSGQGGQWWTASFRIIDYSYFSKFTMTHFRSMCVYRTETN